MDWRRQFINQAKLTVNEFVKVLKADILFEELKDETKERNALSTKKEAFVEAKNIIAHILELDYTEQDWARTSINELIEAGSNSIDSLIAGLSNTIDISEEGIANDAAELRNAIKSRGIAFKDALELIDAVTDLKRIAAEDEIVINDNDFNLGYAEKFTDEYAKLGTKAGYRENIDAVVIDPNGRVGEIITISGLRIALPPQPARSRMLYHKEKKENQYFRREPLPRGLTKKSAKRYEDFINKEFKRKREGLWFLNNGEPEYITGAHWFLMQHFRTAAEGGYYYFTKAQQKVQIFAEACSCDERCYGLIVEKIRRFGMTDTAMSYKLCKSITLRDRIFGMTSKTDADAKANFLRLTWAYSNLPFYFKPICLDEKSKSKLEFSEPSQRISKSNKDKVKVDNSLNTYFNYMPTKEDSYDGTALTGYIADEFSKWKKQNGDTISHWEMVRKALTKGKRITGMAFILSTVENVTGVDPYDDPEKAEAGDRYKWLYYNSDPDRRDANGRTLTGLYKLFISCYEHYEGLIDKYGFPITEDPEKPIMTIDGTMTSIGIKTFIERESDPFRSNPRALYEYFRKTPIYEEDGFRIAEGTCMFNQVNILAQIRYNDNLPVNKKYKDIPNILRKGNFHWVNGIPDCGKVYFKDNPDGKFIIGWMPPEELQNNNYVRNGVLRPGNVEAGAFGVDPYRVNKTIEGKGSKGSMHGFSKPNKIGVPDNFFFLEYICRPETKDIFHDDVIKAIVFYGMPVLVENNVNSLLEEMHRRGYQGFSLKRPDKHIDKLSYDELKFGGIPSNGENVLQMQAAAIEYYIERYVGQLDVQEETYGAMYMNRTLYDWLVFDIKDRTKRDASISSSLAIMACTNYHTKPINIEQNKKIVRAFVRQYDNTGMIGYYKRN